MGASLFLCLPRVRSVAPSRAFPQARLDYVAFLRRDFVSLRMTVLNVRSTLICSGVILSALHFGFLGISTTGLQGVNAISVLLCCFC